MKPKPHSMDGQKTVRIDERTLICVDKSIPDHVAIANYIAKRETLSMRTQSPRWKNKKQEPEEPEVELTEEELTAIVEAVETEDEDQEE